MSVLRKMPYIETVLGDLEFDELQELLAAMNSNSTSDSYYSLVDRNNTIPPLEEGEHNIAAIRLELERGKVYSGFLIHTANISTFIAYHRFQDLALFELDLEAKSYKKINEYCDINELRRVLSELTQGAGSIDPYTLADNMEGANGISVDVNEEGTKVAVSIDLTGANPGDTLVVDDDGNGVHWATGGSALPDWLVVEEIVVR